MGADDIFEREYANHCNRVVDNQGNNLMIPIGDEVCSHICTGNDNGGAIFNDDFCKDGWLDFHVGKGLTQAENNACSFNANYVTNFDGLWIDDKFLPPSFNKESDAVDLENIRQERWGDDLCLFVNVDDQNQCKNYYNNNTGEICTATKTYIKDEFGISCQSSARIYNYDPNDASKSSPQMRLNPISLNRPYFFHCEDIPECNPEHEVNRCNENLSESDCVQSYITENNKKVLCEWKTTFDDNRKAIQVCARSSPMKYCFTPLPASPPSPPGLPDCPGDDLYPVSSNCRCRDPNHRPGEMERSQECNPGQYCWVDSGICQSNPLPACTGTATMDFCEDLKRDDANWCDQPAPDGRPNLDQQYCENRYTMAIGRTPGSIGAQCGYGLKTSGDVFWRPERCTSSHYGCKTRLPLMNLDDPTGGQCRIPSEPIGVQDCPRSDSEPVGSRCRCNADFCEENEFCWPDADKCYDYPLPLCQGNMNYDNCQSIIGNYSVCSQPEKVDNPTNAENEVQQICEGSYSNQSGAYYDRIGVQCKYGLRAPDSPISLPGGRIDPFPCEDNYYGCFGDFGSMRSGEQELIDTNFCRIPK